MSATQVHMSGILYGSVGCENWLTCAGLCKRLANKSFSINLMNKQSADRLILQKTTVPPIPVPVFPGIPYCLLRLLEDLCLSWDRVPCPKSRKCLPISSFTSMYSTDKNVFCLFWSTVHYCVASAPLCVSKIGFAIAGSMPLLASSEPVASSLSCQSLNQAHSTTHVERVYILAESNSFNSLVYLITHYVKIFWHERI